MGHNTIEPLLSEARQLSRFRTIGRIEAIEAGLVEVVGLGTEIKLGDHVCIARGDGAEVYGEVLRLSRNKAIVLPSKSPDGLALGNKVFRLEGSVIAPTWDWLGRILDPMGEPIDGLPLARGTDAMPIKAAPIAPVKRAMLGERLETGLNAFNTLLPIVEGQRLGLFAGSGVGKSSLLGHLTTHLSADVVVLALVGERGRELKEFTQNILGPEGMKRSIVVAATADQSALLRRKCAWTAMAIAESFRDKGNRVLFLADSLTRFAEAHREIAAATGELPTMRGYPPSLSHELMSLCERGGPGLKNSGSITAVLSVLVAGSDMEEPVSDILRGVLDGHIILDRRIAESGRYPAVDFSRSLSRSLPQAASEAENTLLAKVRDVLMTIEQSSMLVSSGLYEAGKSDLIDRALSISSELTDFLTGRASRGIEGSFAQLRLIMKKADAWKSDPGAQLPSVKRDVAIEKQQMS